MARKSKMSILKRQREVKKAEKAALKREKRLEREPTGSEAQLASKDDLEAYGFAESEEVDKS